ncbi:unnamed protein product [Heligmosomoides polygyrus]|uniref:Uncharacterized protein n=1 Tax=Heligmosomoides polygyrus TaxID=6339 RepID=A0A183GBB4_HELPZ|nr:unnamed protein product [Heligmosomoides polygyrus]
MIANEVIEIDFCFELFTHTTTFFGYKYFFFRVIEDDQFGQCIMFNHRVVDAVLVGETDLEETIENLFLNKTDLERMEQNFLDPHIDIEDHFD